MGRLQGPKHRMCRRVGERVCSTDKCPAIKRQQPPGVHGPKGYGRLTEYGTQLREKQKAKYMYGVMENQFRRYYAKSMNRAGNTSEHFLKYLELRLDNAVFKLGFAKTRAQARQMVNHGWITVNDKRVTIPSYQVSAGDVITIKSGAKDSALVKNISEGRKQPLTVPQWLTVDKDGMSGKVMSAPSPDDFPPNLNMTLVVEFYSR